MVHCPFSMAFNFFSKKNITDTNAYISLDIGTEFVKAIIFQVENENVICLGFGKTRQPISAMKGGTVTNIRNVVDTSRHAISKALEGVEILPPKKAVLGIAGELVKGVSVTANYERINPEEKITMEEVQKVVAQVMEPSLQQARQIFLEQGGSDDTQLRIVNSTIIDTYIDDYRVINPLGFQGKRVKFTIYNVYAPLMHVGAMESICEQLGLIPYIIAAEPFAVSRSVKGARELNFDAIIIDIGGGTTDVAVVQKGAVVDTQMFAFGGRVFTKRIAADLGVDYHQAEAMKIQYTQGELERPLASQVRKAISKDIELWVSGVEIALREFKEIKVFPSQILLCGGGTLLPEIKSALSEYPWTSLMPFNRMPKVTFLSPERLDSIIDKTLKLTKPEDVTPVSLARLVLDDFKM